MVKKKVKVTKGFTNILFTMGILGIASLVLQFLGIITIGNFPILMIQTILLGIAFLLEGGIRVLIKYFDNGINQRELAHMFTIFMGLFIIGLGIYGLVNQTIPERFDGVLGISYAVSLFVTIYERFWV
jgi:hypothetical protein